MKRVLALVTLFLAGFGLVCCSYSSSGYKPPSGVLTRVLASQDVSSATSFAGLWIINGQKDMLAQVAPISAGGNPGLMAISPTRATLLAFDPSVNRVTIISTRAESAVGTVQLTGPTTSMVAPITTGFGYAAEPTAVLNGNSPGAVEMMSLNTGAVLFSVSVPNAQTVIANPNGTQLLVFSNDSNSVTVVTPNLTTPTLSTTVTVAGFDQPVYGFFSSDGSVAYILNCGAECHGNQASVQTLNLSTLTPGTPLPVDGATFGFVKGTTLYVAGISPTNNACTGQTTAATSCGRLDIVDLGSMTVIGSAVITDGYHDRMDMSLNGQLFIGSHNCTTINNPPTEIRSCLSIYNTTNESVVVPPALGDVTGFQSFTTRYVEYVAQGGGLQIYDTLKDVLQPIQLVNASGQQTGITGQVIDVKAIDFF